MDKQLLVSILLENFTVRERREILKEKLTKVIELTSALRLEFKGCPIFGVFTVKICEEGKGPTEEVITALEAGILYPLE